MSKIEDLKKNSVGTQFSSENQPLRSGHPKGKRVSTILKETMDMDISQIDKELSGMNINKALALKLVAIALNKKSNDNDKLKAIKEIIDRTEGKATQHVDLVKKIEPRTAEDIKKELREILSDND